MIVLESRNINYALFHGVRFIHAEGIREDSRNGEVLRSVLPVTTVYRQPMERVCLHPWRDANPFFHLIESLWMIAGRDDLASLTKYVSTFGQFSDDGKTVPGAYGKRWRNWDPADPVASAVKEGSWTAWPDQLDRAVEQLRANPRDRRVVIQMWDPAVDIERNISGSKDVPCNISMLPFELDGTLNLTVFCRSNDMVLGAYGANAVHFSFVLEYLAARCGLAVGSYWQVSNNFHAYANNAGDPNNCWPLEWGPMNDPYRVGIVEPFPIFKDFYSELENWKHLGDVAVDNVREQIIKHDLAVFFGEGAYAASQMVRWPFLSRIAIPMALAHQHWKGKQGLDRFTGALEILAQMPEGNDWRRACEDWINRRLAKWQEKHK